VLLFCLGSWHEGVLTKRKKKQEENWFHAVLEKKLTKKIATKNKCPDIDGNTIHVGFRGVLRHGYSQSWPRLRGTPPLFIRRDTTKSSYKKSTIADTRYAIIYCIIVGYDYKHYGLQAACHSTSYDTVGRPMAYNKQQNQHCCCTYVAHFGHPLYQTLNQKLEVELNMTRLGVEQKLAVPINGRNCKHGWEVDTGRWKYTMVYAYLHVRACLSQHATTKR